MTLIRPEILAGIAKGQEVIAAAAIIAFGLWLIWLGGYLLAPVGAAIVITGAVLARLSLRRLRFAQTIRTPGVVELDEAQVGYLGPDDGGFLSLEELVELRLLILQGHRVWRLKQADGQALLIPVDAAGSDRLFDAFAALPGMDTGALVGALDHSAAAQTPPGVDATRVIWRRPAAARLARA